MKTFLFTLTISILSIPVFGQAHEALDFYPDSTYVRPLSLYQINETQSIINVYSYLQCNQSWSSSSLGICTSTVCSEGCAMTCTAMLLKTNGVNVNPGQLNTWLTNNGGYVGGCDIVWGTAANYPGSTMTWYGSFGYNLATIKAEIDAGNPVIVSVFSLSNSVIHHFVVVKGYNGSGSVRSDFVVADPLYSTDQNFASYTLDNGIRIYHNVLGPASSLMCNNDYACGPPAPMPLTINSSCISSACSTVGATPPSPDIPITCSVAYQSARYDDDVWFSITPSTTNPVTITATPTSNMSNFDLVLAVYHGNCLALTQDYCADVNYAGGAEQLTFNPIASTTYLIRVFSYGIGNTYSGNFDICAYSSTSLPDLIITSNSQTANPGVAAAGQFINAGCSEDNIGSGVSGTNDVTLYLSTDAILNTSNDIFLGQISNFPGLSPSQNSLFLSSSVQIPPSTAQGNYYLFFWADGNQVINESTENNNFASFIMLITGTSNGDTENNFSIYPNPSTGIFILSGKIAQGEISISNVVGENIFSASINSPRSTIDLSDKPNGIYFVTVKTETGISTQKIIVSHQ